MGARVKICGVTNLEDAWMAADFGADAIGFNFYQNSARYISPEKLRTFFGDLPPLVSRVGVFVNANESMVKDILAELSLDVLQFHGDESATFCETFGRTYIKALKAGQDLITRSEQYGCASALLVDSFDGHQFGGTGKVFDWAILPEIKKPLLLAGGLTPDNVEQAIRQVRPYAVDVSSGVERSRGIKDKEKMSRFFAAVEKGKQVMNTRSGTNESLYAYPDERGHFGVFGGKFVSETLMAALKELESEYQRLRHDPVFKQELARDLSEYVGRESPLYFAERLTKSAGGAKIFLKREDLNHTGAHKINNCIGQALLAKYMGKPRIIAETGAGQHGVASATVAARFGLECRVYMGSEDIKRQSLNVYRMKLLGAEVVPVTSGSRTLKDALNEAMRDWVTNVDNTHYIIGTVAGPHPYPMLVRDFQSVIGEETKRQFAAMAGGLPDALVACVGGGSNAMGMFYPFLEDRGVRLIGVEAAGFGLESGKHAAPLNKGTIGVLHGNRTYVMNDPDGQIIETHSVSAGLDYPGVGPEHSFLKDVNRAEYVAIDDEEALAAFRTLNLLEGILPALESSHAVAYGMKLAAELDASQSIVINLSGRGDKDIPTVARIDGISIE